MPQEYLTFYQRILEIRKEVEILKKDADDYDDMRAFGEYLIVHVKELMEKYRITAVPSERPGSNEITLADCTKTKTIGPYSELNEGSSYMRDVNWRLLDIDDSEKFFDIPWRIYTRFTATTPCYATAVLSGTNNFLLAFFAQDMFPDL